jgi:hypothetical protein
VVVYGAVQKGAPLLELVKQHYPPSRVAFVDGDDWRGWDYMRDQPRASVLGEGTYFKREMPNGCPR